MGQDEVPDVIVTWGQYEVAKGRLRVLIAKGARRTLAETGLMSLLTERILDYERRTLPPDDPVDFIM
jgi:hypothetical protein